MLGRFFFAMKRPEIPAIPVLPNGKKDSSYPYRYVKDNWWSGVSFDDESLVRTPFLNLSLRNTINIMLHLIQTLLLAK
ncbi:MAG: hypothetical protein WKG06_05035 [Segetibacter sp.]